MISEMQPANAISEITTTKFMTTNRYAALTAQMMPPIKIRTANPADDPLDFLRAMLMLA